MVVDNLRLWELEHHTERSARTRWEGSDYERKAASSLLKKGRPYP